MTSPHPTAGAGVGAYMGGAIYDQNVGYGGYDLAVGVCGVLCASAGAVLCLLPGEPLVRMSKPRAAVRSTS